MKHFFTILMGLLFSSTCCYCQNKTIDSLLLAFKDALFEYKVKPAKSALENYQKAVIPKIIPMLYNRSAVGLGDAPYLMYPASDNYEPTHGYFIPYNLDWISIRAGWLLEDLTFMDFGYETELDEKRLAEVCAQLYGPSTHKNTITYLHWIDKPTKITLQKTRRVMADKVAAWWQLHKTNWTRLDAIKDALQSNNKRRLLRVIEYLQSGETPCDGLTTDVYAQSIKPFVILLKKTTDKSVKDAAEQLLTNGISNNITPNKVD